MLYKAINGESMTSSPQTSNHLPIERRDDLPTQPRYEGPPTPCPAKVEYATPVFAKNYQGIWRYVVQIPYEGYFTQTVEVTRWEGVVNGGNLLGIKCFFLRCLQSRCHYLDGGCLSSPRWSSLLVAEIYYPDTVLSGSDTINAPRSPVSASQPPPVQDFQVNGENYTNNILTLKSFQNYQQYLHKRAGLQAAPVDSTTTNRPPHCDGVDALGCFQVRLYYDWFLIPGSCKCWRPDYFNKYVRRKTSTADL